MRRRRSGGDLGAPLPEAVTEVQKRLFALQDKGYQAGSVKLNPTVDPDTIIGVRIPQLRALAKEMKGTQDAAAFLGELPHRYFEEYSLHSFLIGYLRDFDAAVDEVERLLPHLNSWALTDSMRVKAFDKEPERLLAPIDRWLGDEHPYTVRYGILCLMNYFLDDRFSAGYLDRVSAIRSDEYYVNMMIAWYFATALAKQYEATVAYIEDRRLDRRTHNKAIQKAVESYRVTEEQKAYLKTLRWK